MAKEIKSCYKVIQNSLAFSVVCFVHWLAFVLSKFIRVTQEKQAAFFKPGF